MVRKPKLSLVNVFLIFFVIAFIFSLILSGVAFYFNNRLIKNQDRLLAVVALENARYKMSRAQTEFLIRQEGILVAEDEKELDALVPREKLERMFSLGEKRVAGQIIQNEKVAESLRGIG